MVLAQDGGYKKKHYSLASQDAPQEILVLGTVIIPKGQSIALLLLGGYLDSKSEMAKCKRHQCLSQK